MSKHDVVIIGGGISGLAALHYVRTRCPERSVRLLEADSRLGGTIGTDLVEGHSFDWGPNGFLDREPLTLELCEELGLNDLLERANENVNNRFILRGGKLRTVPMSPPKFLMSDILSLSGKLRVMWEPFAAGMPGDDESIYSFASRRIGRQAADYLVQPMVSGVYGGLAERLSLQSCFPIMRKMESEHGSLFRAMMAKKKEAKAKKTQSGGPSGPGGRLTSFRGGLYRIIERFVELYSDSIELNSPVDAISRENTGYIIDREGRASMTAKDVILATPAYQSSRMVSELSESLSDELLAIPYAPIAVVCLGYKREQVAHPLDGFGFLVPPKEGRDILGSIWTSSIFADRSPEGEVQFRTMLGGDGNHDVIDLSDAELVARVRQDLGEIVGLTGEPTIARVFTWPNGIPQFVVGHQARMERIEMELQRLGHLHLASNAYFGISLNDCVKQASKVVHNIRS